MSPRLLETVFGLKGDDTPGPFAKAQVRAEGSFMAFHKHAWTRSALSQCPPLSSSAAASGALAPAIGLRREGWSTVILESAPQINEVGAGIQIPANSGRILVKWGLRDKIDAVARRWVVDAAERLEGEEVAGPNPGPLTTIHTNTAVSSVDSENASAKTTDGRTFSGDVLIGVDGVRSVVKVAVTGDPDNARPSGDKAFRF
ncbi:hypothetical protein M427DRAFT_34770 [Gonapodya prolifera JEL478]|uniref:FAD-binding domain-containing protein n=1 Tax=Gonapodya prolifera (strain JEL478) TaxID=1344416 RepID=A0A139A7P5_GONPJ|nr:hypothetical protein M427DRAFT_34770 [Gonapodya prolifera JEL478]|eukprot:KXS12393.1 hypothetical protein M427DRAFT_34770 [Gonapodya prolifera JEL478]